LTLAAATTYNFSTSSPPQISRIHGQAGNVRRDE